MYIRDVILAVLLVFVPAIATAEKQPALPETAEKLIPGYSVSYESEFEGIFYDCELYLERLRTTDVFFRVCKIRDSAEVDTHIWFSEAFMGGELVWAREGYSIQK